jgi:hypothetical protein
MYFIQEFPDSWSNEWEVYKVRKAFENLNLPYGSVSNTIYMDTKSIDAYRKAFGGSGKNIIRK